jgi:TPR repeat protein
MTPTESAKLLGLEPGATPEQAEARFLELRARLEEKIGRAPTPGLKEKYRATLTSVTEAFESFALAADSSSLPVLRQFEPAGSASSARTAATVVISPAATATAEVAPTPLALAEISGSARFIRNAAATIRFCIVTGLVGILVLFASLMYFDSAYPDGWPLHMVVLEYAVSLFVGSLAGGWVVRRSVRKSREDTTGKRHKRDRRDVILAGVGGTILAAVVVLLILPGGQGRDPAHGWRDSLALRAEKPRVDAALDATLLLESEAEAALATLRAQERELAVRKPTGDAANELLALRAMIKAQEIYVQWVRETVATHPARMLREKSAAAFAKVEQVDSQANDDAAREVFYSYQAAVDGLTTSLQNRKPVREWVIAIDQIREAAEAGEPEQMHDLALAYDRGNLGVKQDDVLAFEWYRKAAAKGDAKSMMAIARAHSAGRGAPQSDSLALEWYRKAAENGDVDGMLITGDYYLKGHGTAPDPAAAVGWYRKAAEKDNEIAFLYLGICHHEGLGVARDDAAAVGWYQKAVAKGPTRGRFDALYALGIHHEQGWGVPKSDAAALDAWRKAAAAGDSAAKRLLEWEPNRQPGTPRRVSYPKIP